MNNRSLARQLRAAGMGRQTIVRKLGSTMEQVCRWTGTKYRPRKTYDEGTKAQFVRLRRDNPHLTHQQAYWVFRDLTGIEVAMSTTARWLELADER